MPVTVEYFNDATKRLVEAGQLNPLGDDFKIRLNPDYFSTNRRIDPDNFVLAMLQRQWALPGADPLHTPTGIGTSGHNGQPSTIDLGTLRNPITGIFAKSYMPDETYLATEEFANSIICQKRGIPTTTVIAYIEDENGGVLISQFDHQIVPLTFRDFSYYRANPTNYPPENFIDDVFGFIADMHNHGMAHGDLHIGNIGFRYSRSGIRPTLAVLDLETATVLNDVDANFKRHEMHREDIQLSRFEYFEGEVKSDLTRLTADFLGKSFPIRGTDLAKLVSDAYTSKRTLSYYPFTESATTIQGYLEEELLS